MGIGIPGHHSGPRELRVYLASCSGGWDRVFFPLGTAYEEEADKNHGCADGVEDVVCRVEGCGGHRRLEGDDALEGEEHNATETQKK
jgi:hypothetical protein